MVYKIIEKNWQLISKVTNIPLKLFLKITKFCIEEASYFKFDNCFYKQKKGLAMGSPASPILADIILVDILDETISQLGYDPQLVIKYVDDILMIIPRSETENTLTTLNSINENIKFTLEYSDNNKIPYLDILIIKCDNGKVLTDYYQKPTSSGRILNFKSNHPMLQKTGTAYGLISRIYTLSSAQFIKNNTKLIYKILNNNNYPNNLINKLINKYNNKNVTKNTNNTAIKPTTITKYHGLIYEKHLTENINKLLRKQDPGIKLGFKPNNTVGQIHNNPKQAIDKLKKNGIVYEIQCEDCNKTYIGQTGQLLKNRMAGHKSDFKLKNTKTDHTAATQHMIDTHHIFNIKTPTILHSKNHFFKRQILETLYIHKNREKTVNIRSDLDKMQPAYTQLIE